MTVALALRASPAMSPKRDLACRGAPGILLIRVYLQSPTALPSSGPASAWKTDASASKKERRTWREPYRLLPLLTNRAAR